MPRINDEFIARWVEELRSGRHKQGQGALRNVQGEECCLGVAADLMVQDGTFGVSWLDVPLPAPENHPVALLWNGLSFPGTLPLMLAEHIGMEHGGGWFSPEEVEDFFLPGETEPSSLSNANDSGASFDDIADYLEEKVLGRASVRTSAEAPQIGEEVQG